MLNTKAAIVLGLSLTASLSMALFYFLRKKFEENEEPYTTNKSTQIKMKVPKNSIGSIVGREGSTIKAIEAQTNTKIRFVNNEEEEDEAERVMVIKGSLEAAHEAESLVSHIIRDQPKVVTEEIVVPARACGRIIGRNGDTIKAMCWQSKARISVDRRSRDYRDPDHPVKVTLRGTPEQIKAAVDLISAKVAEEECFRTKGPSQPLPIDEPLPPTSLSRVGQESGGLESGLSVSTFVSAVHSPHSFWVQLVSPASTTLDRMTENMTSFYASLQAAPQQASPLVGDLVAAPFPADNCWYRACIQALSTDDYSGKTSVKVHYVDFGDEEELPVEHVYQLLPQYVSFPPQALACSLAYVKPAKGQEQWSDEASERFAQLVHASQWRPLITRRVGVTAEGRHLVELVDTNTPQDLYVDHMLVEEGLADWDSPHLQSSTDPSSVSSAQPLQASNQCSSKLDSSKTSHQSSFELETSKTSHQSPSKTSDQSSPQLDTSVTSHQSPSKTANQSSSKLETSKTSHQSSFELDTSKTSHQSPSKTSDQSSFELDTSKISHQSPSKTANQSSFELDTSKTSHQSPSKTSDQSSSKLETSNTSHQSSLELDTSKTSHQSPSKTLDQSSSELDTSKTSHQCSSELDTSAQLQ